MQNRELASSELGGGVMHCLQITCAWAIQCTSGRSRDGYPRARKVLEVSEEVSRMQRPDGQGCVGMRTGPRAGSRGHIIHMRYVYLYGLCLTVYRQADEVSSGRSRSEEAQTPSRGAEPSRDGVVSAMVLALLALVASLRCSRP